MLSHWISIFSEREENIITVQRSVIESVRNYRYVFIYIYCYTCICTSRFYQQTRVRLLFQQTLYSSECARTVLCSNLNWIAQEESIFHALLRLHIKAYAIRAVLNAREPKRWKYIYSWSNPEERQQMELLGVHYVRPVLNASTVQERPVGELSLWRAASRAALSPAPRILDAERVNSESRPLSGYSA